MPSSLATPQTGVSGSSLPPASPSSNQGCLIIKESAVCPSIGNAEHSIGLAAISPILVIIGWFVVTKTQANRERRKQIREFASGLLDRLDELEVLVVEYHTAERNRSKEHEIISKLTRFEKACGSVQDFVAGQCFFPAVKKSLLDIDAKKIRLLRSAMTLSHFSDEHSGALPHDSMLIQELELAACTVIDELERIRIVALD